MADGFVISDVGYAGEAASSFIVKAITGAQMIQGGHVYVKDGIKYKFTIPTWDANYEDLIQDRQATPVSKGSMNVGSAVLEPQDWMLYMEFNPREFESHWFATQMNPMLLDAALPATVESVVIQGVMARHEKYFNKLMLIGDKTRTDIYKYFNGFIKTAVLNADVLDCGSPTTLTSSNIVTELEKGYALIPQALKYNPGLKYYVSYATYDLYTTYQISQTYKGIDATMEGVRTYKGVPIVPIADFPDNTYLIAKGSPDMSSNMWLGVNTMDDATVKLDKVSNSSDLWFVKCIFKADVNFGFGSEVVLYGTI